ncbi:PREDICTED: zinc finger protein 468-like, partial [Buceros rhinoceros silvestris]|uniref:zinc finger protein 468-like n=1 Tax=Buceros rhinoceros silvestris TaxID=175836 RepID=UPI0005289152
PDTFEIVLPITVFVLGVDDFPEDAAEEQQAASVPELKEEDEEEVNFNSTSSQKRGVTPSNGAFASAIGLQRHRRLHTGEEMCRGQQLDLVSRGKRTQRLHQGAKCEYATRMLSNLGVHVKIHTGDKPYSCSVCQKKFHRKGNLKLHWRIHTGEKPFQCSQCGIAFRMSSHLKRHLVIHSKLHRRR